MSKPRLLIASLHSRYNPLTGNVDPTIDLNPASKIGELVLLSDWRQGHDPQEAIEQIKDTIQTIGLREDDLILSAGSPLLLGVLLAIYSDHHQTARVLEWERSSSSYVVQTVNL